MNKDIIKVLRKSHNLNQREFARMVNCSFALIGLVEVGKRRVTEDLEKKVKEAFELDDSQVQSITAIIKTLGEGIPPFM